MNHTSLNTYLLNGLTGRGHQVDGKLTADVIDLLAAYQVLHGLQPGGYTVGVTTGKTTRKSAGVKKFNLNTFVSYLLGKSSDPDLRTGLNLILEDEPLQFNSDSKPSPKMDKYWEKCESELADEEFIDLESWNSRMSEIDLLKEISGIQRGNVLKWFLSDEAQQKVKELMKTADERRQNGEISTKSGVHTGGSGSNRLLLDCNLICRVGKASTELNRLTELVNLLNIAGYDCPEAKLTPVKTALRGIDNGKRYVTVLANHRPNLEGLNDGQITQYFKTNYDQILSEFGLTEESVDVHPKNTTFEKPTVKPREKTRSSLKEKTSKPSHNEIESDDDDDLSVDLD